MHEIENVLANERIKQITEEIMRPDSKHMKKINAKTREIMQPNSKYMKDWVNWVSCRVSRETKVS